jgi:hypothetical protein
MADESVQAPKQKKGDVSELIYGCEEDATFKAVLAQTRNRPLYDDVLEECKDTLDSNSVASYENNIYFQKGKSSIVSVSEFYDGYAMW